MRQIPRYARGDLGGAMLHKERVDIVLAFCDKSGLYARHTTVVIASIFANTESRVLIHLLHDDTLTSENRANLLGTADAFNQDIVFINVGGRLRECVLGNKRHAFPGAQGMYYRLLIPSVCDCDKIIYLDCDTVVNLDIAELWDIPLGGKAIAAVPENSEASYPPGLKRWVRWQLAYRAMGMDFKHSSYFNSGVLVMDLKRIREKYDFLKAVSDFYANFRHITQFADQDCFNSIFSRDCLYIDNKFNRAVEGSTEIVHDYRSIWHFMGMDKPWDACVNPEIDKLYWRYLAMTHLCRNTEKLIEVMLSSMWRSKYWHQRTSACTKRLWQKLTRNFTKGHLLDYPKIFWYSYKALWGRKRANRLQKAS